MISARLCNLSKLESIPVRVTPSQLWFRVKSLVRRNVDTEFIKNLKTQKGETQSSERIYMEKLYNILDDNGYKYSKAPEQQPIDLRNIYHFSDPDVKLMIEAKMMGSTTIKCNDTVPGCESIYNPENLPVRYILFVVGNRNIKTEVVFVDDGKDFRGVREAYNCREHILAMRELYKKKKNSEERRNDMANFLTTAQTLANNYDGQCDEIGMCPRINLSLNVQYLLSSSTKKHILKK